MMGLQKRQLHVTILVVCSLEQQTDNFSGSSYHEKVRIQTKVNHSKAIMQCHIQSQCKGFNPKVNILNPHLDSWAEPIV